jgi:multiple sugar transport system substrate-binding protein
MIHPSRTESRRGSLRRPLAVLAMASAAALALAGCAPAATASSSGEPDDGTKLTLWVRSATDAFSNALADAYNKSHKNQVTVTVIPNDNYLQKIGAAAGSNSLPDLLASDVVYTPEYVHNGLLQDLTEQVEGLDFADQLAQAHIEAASKDGKIYGVPHKVDSSVLLYNKDLYRQAGLDPEAPPTNFEEMYEHAKAIRALGGDTYGFYFAGSCGGCGVYTLFPYAAAAGNEALTDGGEKADIDNEAMAETFALYKRMFDEDIAPSSAKSDDGTTWDTLFTEGKVGLLPLGSFAYPALREDATFDWGVAPLMAPDGSGTSTFVGGDTLGISKSSKKATQAWDFIEWTLSEEAQVEVIAKSGDLPARTDLADNPYSAEDPRVVTTIEGMANGYTPATLPFGDIFNNPNGVWVETLRAAIFGDDVSAALTEGQDKIQSAIDDAY